MQEPNIALISLEVFLLVLASAICSGLNIALMSLDMADLRRKAKLGDTRAKRVLPLRKKVHLTLGSILFTNVAAVSASSLVLDQVLEGWMAGLVSTILIVVFGEVMPQALFSKNPLAWTSFFAPLLKAMIAITYVLSKPLQLLLDKLFPLQRKRLQTRQELGLLITEHLSDDTSELDDGEVEIMRGALQLSEKKVRDIMTPLRSVFWLTPDTMLDAKKIDEIKERGFSRIPVLDEKLSECYGLLLMKDLVDIDFDENPVTIMDFRLHPTQVIGSKTALDTMFRKFIAAKAHMVPIEKDDKIIGIVTIEDLIEEIIGREIEDETDRSRQLIKDMAT
jgi:metal transporter CNNM